MSDVKPMALSTAIRLGSMWKPSGRGHLLEHGRTYALGAALDAVGYFESPDARTDGRAYAFAKKYWPMLGTPAAITPARYNPGIPMVDLVWILNDDGWTREAIADWVEQVEREHAPQAVETPEAVAAVAQNVDLPVPTTRA